MGALIEPPPLPRLFTAKEIKRMLGVSDNTLTKHVSRGDFPAPLRIGRYLRWPESEVTAWLKQQKRKARHR
jgi:excisionase family DNA binding protein